MRPRSFGLLIPLSLALAVPSSAQTVLHTPNGTIELIGLKRWTVAMIEDSLAKYSPTDTLTVHACAAILEGKLHFAAASVTVYTNMPEFDFKRYTAITLVEPEDSATIHYKPWRFDTLHVRADWAEAATVFRKNNGIAQTAIQTPSFYRERLSSADSARFAKVDALHRVVVANRTPLAFSEALRTIASDSNIYDRTIAAVILGNFAERDSAWFALVDALRDPVGPPSATASEVLGMLVASSPRTVDWRPATTELRYLLDGTHVSTLGTTLDVLTATKVSASLAPVLLAGGGSVLRAKLRSGDVFARRSVAAVLSQLSGLPASSDATAFETWLASIHRASSDR